MANLIQAAKDQVAVLTRQAYEKAAQAGQLPGGLEVKGSVEIPKDVSHGDYASSFAMAGAKAMHLSLIHISTSRRAAPSRAGSDPPRSSRAG